MTVYDGTVCRGAGREPATSERPRRARPGRRLPVGPLVGAVENRFGPIAARLGAAGSAGLVPVLGARSARNYYRCVAAGAVTWSMADRFAGALGRHPAEIWGDAWYQLDTPAAAAS